MFLNQIRNILFAPDTKFVSATRAQANGETFVSATMCPQQCVLLCQGFYMAGNSTDTESAREFLCFMGLEPCVDPCQIDNNCSLL